jgi:hypothetical protein
MSVNVRVCLQTEPRLYAVGGGDSTAEVYIPTADAWSFVASMVQPRPDAGYALFNGA